MLVSCIYSVLCAKNVYIKLQSCKQQHSIVFHLSPLSLDLLPAVIGLMLAPDFPHLAHDGAFVPIMTAHHLDASYTRWAMSSIAQHQAAPSSTGQL